MAAPTAPPSSPGPFCKAATSSVANALHSLAPARTDTATSSLCAALSSARSIDERARDPVRCTTRARRLCRSRIDSASRACTCGKATADSASRLRSTTRGVPPSARSGAGDPRSATHRSTDASDLKAGQTSSRRGTRKRPMRDSTATPLSAAAGGRTLHASTRPATHATARLSNAVPWRASAWLFAPPTPSTPIANLRRMAHR